MSCSRAQQGDAIGDQAQDLSIRSHTLYLATALPTENIRLSPYNIVKSLSFNSNQRTIGPENAHLKPDLGVLSHHETTLTFIYFISCLHLQRFRS